MVAFARTLGVDVSKRQLDGQLWPDGGGLSVGNNEAGFAALQRHLVAHPVDAVAVEASGGYERKLVEALRAAGHRVVVLAPREVRLFAEMRRKRAKNDRLDARVIAEFAALFGEERPARSPALERLAAYLTYYEQLSAAVAQAKTQLESVADDEVRALVGDQVRRLTADKRALLVRIRALVEADDDLNGQVRRLQSMPGIGFLNAVTLAVRLPELGRLSRHAIACLIGVAPSMTRVGATKAAAFVAAAGSGSERCSTWPPPRPSAATRPSRPSANGSKPLESLTSSSLSRSCER
ncbi:hypothetical protein D3093_12535 [Azospirillum argentinense]|uniref:Uncharacterized protein n=1 Tax=Azospirillum argentinense TaxID=2970906 RepID=A0A4D8PHX3_9PROT|nr:transposase [Azospirillum argentinense]QCN96017.1 hypothetical protein D3093_12535 [Azospirillum argentinense]